jgi:hypothetical protein
MGLITSCATSSFCLRYLRSTFRGQLEPQSACQAMHLAQPSRRLAFCRSPRRGTRRRGSAYHQRASSRPLQHGYTWPFSETPPAPICHRHWQTQGYVLPSLIPILILSSNSNPIPCPNRGLHQTPPPAPLPNPVDPRLPRLIQAPPHRSYQMCFGPPPPRLPGPGSEDERVDRGARFVGRECWSCAVLQ